MKNNTRNHYQQCVKELLEYSNKNGEEFKKIIEYIKKKKKFTPLGVATNCNVGYARAVVTIDLLCELGYTDFHGYITPSRKFITLLNKKDRPKRNLPTSLEILESL